QTAIPQTYKRVKIAFFAISPRRDGGVYQYTLSAIEAFKKLGCDREIQITFFHSPDYADCFATATNQWRSVNTTHTDIGRDVFLATYFGKRINALDNEAFDLAVSPKTCLAGYGMARKFVVTLHDLQHKHFPQYFRFYRRRLRDLLYSRAVNLADVTICETNYVKQDIVSFYDVDPSKILVLPSPPPNYVSSIIEDARLHSVKQRYNLPNEYLFYPAQFWFHKNHIRLFKALDILGSSCGIDVPLVLVGSPREAFSAAMQEIANLKLESRIRYLGYVPDQDMPYLFKLSTCLVLPTLFESLSIPMWEAFRLEVPVVCSNVCALPEQAGPAAIFFDPYDPGDMARGIRDLLVEPAKAEKLIDQGKQR